MSHKSQTSLDGHWTKWSRRRTSLRPPLARKSRLSILRLVVSFHAKKQTNESRETCDICDRIEDKVVVSQTEKSVLLLLYFLPDVCCRLENQKVFQAARKRIAEKSKLPKLYNSACDIWSWQESHVAPYHYNNVICRWKLNVVVRGIPYLLSLRDAIAPTSKVLKTKKGWKLEGLDTIWPTWGCNKKSRKGLNRGPGDGHCDTFGNSLIRLFSQRC